MSSLFSCCWIMTICERERFWITCWFWLPFRLFPCLSFFPCVFISYFSVPLNLTLNHKALSFFPYITCLVCSLFRASYPNLPLILSLVHPVIMAFKFEGEGAVITGRSNKSSNIHSLMPSFSLENLQSCSSFLSFTFWVPSQSPLMIMITSDLKFSCKNLLKESSYFSSFIVVNEWEETEQLNPFRSYVILCWLLCTLFGVSLGEVKDWIFEGSFQPQNDASFDNLIHPLDSCLQ